MILYHNGSFWRLVLEHKGSIVFRRDSLLPALVIAILAECVQVSISFGWIWAPDLPHYFGVMSLGSIVAFAVVFRTSLGWGRYWEAMTHLQLLYSKLADSYMQIQAFSRTTIFLATQAGTTQELQRAGRVQKALSRLEQNFSLVSAMAADRLAHGDTNRMEKRASVARWSQQLVMRCELRGGPDLTGARKLPKFLDKSSQRDSKQNLDRSWDAEYLIFRSLTEAEKSSLSDASDRVNLIMYWLLHDLAMIAADVNISAPIQSRMYQELSTAQMALSNCMKIADVPFPFPYAQLLTVLLVFYSFVVPIYIVVFTDSLIMSPVLSFLLFQGIWGVNEVAKELENPFGHDVNDISLVDFHARYMDHLIDIQKDTISVINSRDLLEPIDLEHIQFLGVDGVDDLPPIAMTSQRNSGSWISSPLPSEVSPHDHHVMMGEAVEGPKRSCSPGSCSAPDINEKIATTPLMEVNGLQPDPGKIGHLHDLHSTNGHMNGGLTLPETSPPFLESVNAGQLWQDLPTSHAHSFPMDSPPASPLLASKVPPRPELPRYLPSAVGIQPSPPKAPPKPSRIPSKEHEHRRSIGSKDPGDYLGQHDRARVSFKEPFRDTQENDLYEIDQGLALIGSRMEVHLANITKQVEMLVEHVCNPRGGDRL